MDAASRGGVRGPGRRAAARRRRAGRESDGMAAERRRGGGSGAVRDRELADRAAPPDALEPRQGAGPVGAPARALVRHAWLSGAEREPTSRLRNLSSRMSKSGVGEDRETSDAIGPEAKEASSSGARAS